MGEVDGMPFIGSHISLISKSGIRYEGVLNAINIEESSIALQNGEECRRWRVLDGRLAPLRQAAFMLCVAGLHCYLGAYSTFFAAVPRSALFWHGGPAHRRAASAWQQRDVRVHHLSGCVTTSNVCETALGHAASGLAARQRCECCGSSIVLHTQATDLAAAVPCCFPQGRTSRT